MTRHDPSSTLQSSTFTKKTSLKLLVLQLEVIFKFQMQKKPGMHFMIIKKLKEQYCYSTKWKWIGQGYIYLATLQLDKYVPLSLTLRWIIAIQNIPHRYIKKCQFISFNILKDGWELNSWRAILSLGLLRGE